MYRVLICDDQNISRQLFELFVAHSERYELAASIPSAAAADDSMAAASATKRIAVTDFISFSPPSSPP